MLAEHAPQRLPVIIIPGKVNPRTQAPCNMFDHMADELVGRFDLLVQHIAGADGHRHRRECAVADIAMAA